MKMLGFILWASRGKWSWHNYFTRIALLCSFISGEDIEIEERNFILE